MNELLTAISLHLGALHVEAGAIPYATERLGVMSAQAVAQVSVDRPIVGPLSWRFSARAEHRPGGDVADVSARAGLALGPVFVGWLGTDLEPGDVDGGGRGWAAVSVAAEF